jgi:LmbE family N-acetylglucosaminyl deacetylase
MLPIEALNNVGTGGQPVALEAIGFSPDLRLLVLAPHPDDFDAISITLRYFHENGNEIHLCVLSGGSKGVQDSYSRPPTREHKTQLREQEQLNSCNFFGIAPTHINFLRLPETNDGELARDAANEDRVWQQISTISPDILFLPCGKDSNTGHQRTYIMAREALRKLGKPLLALYNQDIKTLTFRTDLYTGFNETQADWKRTLLRFHDSQQTRNMESRGHGLDDRILSFNRTLAGEHQLATRYAETFQIELFYTGH